MQYITVQLESGNQVILNLSKVKYFIQQPQGGCVVLIDGDREPTPLLDAFIDIKRRLEESQNS